MGGEWRQTTLGKVVRLQRGHDLPDKIRTAGSVPVMGSFGVTGWHNESRAKAPGVTVGRSGASIGVVSFVPRNDYWPLNTCLYVTDFQGNDPHFCYYWLGTLDLAAYNSGSAQPSLNRNHIYGMPVRVPGVQEQHAIADILGSLDDKIELNRRTNETLEAMARALFKSWFVDFDPVVAKSEGRQPDGMDAETAKLFPNSFVDSEIGQVPKGWMVGAYGDVASSRREIADVGEFPPETAYIGLEHLPRRSIALSEWTDASSVESAKSRFSKGDVLFGKLRPYFHKVGIAPVDGVCSTDILVIVPRRAELSAFILGHASSDEMVDYADGCSTGTRMPRVSWGDLSRYPLPIPPPELAGHFSKTLAPIFDAIIANIHETRSLSLLRDVLLPKLLAGQVRVS